MCRPQIIFQTIFVKWLEDINAYSTSESKNKLSSKISMLNQKNLGSLG